ncbi:hypothetical protein ACQHIV_18815 [Kribbella sp. GL6]|uniref:hypothetical protein n=1 Tax=Kribbella sp. GL6 TaxID=3419765 RepID=UPI003CFDE5AE
MVPSIASAIALVSADSTAYKIGAAVPVALGSVLLIGGLIALLRILRRDRAAQLNAMPSPSSGVAVGPDAMQHGFAGAPHASGVQKPKSRAKQVAIVCIAIGGLVVLGRLSNLVQAVSAEPDRRIEIAETAGGAPRVQLAPEVTAALEQRREAAAKKGLDFQYGGYAHPKGGDAFVLFMGGEQHISDPEQAITDLFAGMAESSGEQARPTEYPAGDLGGEVRCATTTGLNCAWEDRSTYGVLTAADMTEPELAALLVKMRTDLEQSK